MAKRFLILAIILVALLLGGYGCMFNKQASFKDLALDYMEKKYGEEFEFISPYGASYADMGKKKTLVKSASYPDNIFVIGEEDGNSYSFGDNYLSVKYKENIKEEVKSASDAVFGDSVVFCNVLMQALPSGLPADSTFERYTSSGRSGVSATIVVPYAAKSDSLANEFAEKFNEKNISITIRLVMPDNELYSSVSENSIDDLIGQEKYRYFAVILFDGESFRIDTEEVR